MTIATVQITQSVCVRWGMRAIIVLVYLCQAGVPARMGHKLMPQTRLAETAAHPHPPER
jgi:hypothetical protein